MKVIYRMWAIVLGMIVAQPLNAATIGLYADPACTNCNLTVPVGSSQSIYIRFSPQGLGWAHLGVAAVEFKIAGLPPGWFALVQPSSLATTVGGDLFGDGGALSFVPGAVIGDCVILYTVTLFAVSGGSATLHVEARTSSSWSHCPNATGPDTCDFCRDCVDGGTLLVNSPLQCSTAVESSAWSQIKRLYQ